MENQNLNNQPLINPSEKAKSKWLNSLVFLIFGIMIGVVGLLGYQRYFVNRPVTVNSTTPYPTLTATPNPTAEWKTYINSVHKVSFRYPLSWSLTQEAGQYVNGKIYNTKVKLSKGDALITMYLNMDGIGGQPQTYEGTSFVLDGHHLFQFKKVNSYNSTKEIGISDSLTILGVFTIDNVTYSITITYPTNYTSLDEENLLKEFNQILSTFKFINKSTNDETMEWKIFKNDVLTFKYPKDWVVSFGNSHAPTYPSDTIVLKSSPSSFDINLIVKKENNDLEATFLNFVKNTFGDFQPTIILKESNMIEGYIIEVGPNNSKLKITIKILSNGDKKLIATTILPDNKISIFNQILSTFKFLN